MFFICVHRVTGCMQELPVRQRRLCTSTQTRSPLNQDLDWSLKPLISFHCFLHFFNHWMCCHVVVLSCFDPQPANIHTQKHNETMFLLVNSLFINEVFVIFVIATVAIFLWDKHTDCKAMVLNVVSLSCPQTPTDTQNDSTAWVIGSRPHLDTHQTWRPMPKVWLKHSESLCSD